jgi:hypothetical protein
MDLNSIIFEELYKLNMDEMNRRMQFNETYQLYSDELKKNYCVDLKFIKICF